MCSGIENQGFNPEEDKVKVAQITMAYNNSQIIKRLQQRGLLIKKEQWAKLEQKNQEILNEIKAEPLPGKTSLLDKLQTPVSVFATFESEEGYQRACAYGNYAQRAICGQKFELQEASEPSDIIWENRHFTPHQRTVKRLIIYFVIIVLLCISGAIIFVCTTKSLTLKFKYPQVKCPNVAEDYNVKKDYSLSANDLTRWTDDAMKEFHTNKAYEDANQQTHYQGIMQCFCQYRSKAGDKKAKVYKSSLDGSEAAICDLYNSDNLKSKILGQSVAFIIIAINTVLRMIIIAGITWVGEDTNSEQLSSITNGVFIAQFFNTGILLLLVNGNMSEH